MAERPRRSSRPGLETQSKSVPASLDTWGDTYFLSLKPERPHYKKICVFLTCH